MGLFVDFRILVFWVDICISIINFQTKIIRYFNYLRIFIFSNHNIMISDEIAYSFER